jgi:hypothetical protein
MHFLILDQRILRRFRDLLMMRVHWRRISEASVTFGRFIVVHMNNSRTVPSHLTGFRS